MSIITRFKHACHPERYPAKDLVWTKSGARSFGSILRKTHRIMVLLPAFLFIGCANNQSAQVQLPPDARMLAYGRYIPATYVPDEPGLLYYVDVTTGKVVHIMSNSGRHAGTPLAAEQLPESMKASFDTSKQYRVYFVPQSGNPQNNAPHSR